jgi:hypothetical protein
MKINGIETEVTEHELRKQVVLLGGNPDDRSQLCMMAFLVDSEFREKVTRLFFERSLKEVAA